ncbi:neural-cadherin-like, partial [Sitophilus oryzae]|uniref:Neural-cadherin-like n=1 Tax=Sitophilus oryzae TaxID=7048 RepID=A0A6J2X372_SITOR
MKKWDYLNLYLLKVGGGTNSGQFVIEEITGVIRLHSKPISLDRDKYELNVTAMDDGACCVNGDLTIHTSTAVVVVFITDVNDNKPMFKDCGTYYPKVEEGAPNGSPVIKVHATDEDKGVNGQVKYSIVQQPNQKGTKFTVDEETGEVSTNKVFDREGDDGKFVSVTVKATDQGEPSLEGVCSFTVEITDVNDNPPLFDRQKYVENVKQDASIGTNILRVSASDEDADNNGAIVYTLSAGSNPADLEYFEIQPESGWIILKKPLDRDRYRLRVRASDRGTPPSFADVDIELDVVDRNNKPPLWDRDTLSPIHIKENVTVGTVVTSVKARFRETYKLEATAQDKGYPPLARSVEVQIDVVDRANNPPVWDHVVYGPIYIRENFPVGAKVYYYIVESPRNEGKDFFEINKETGEVFTKVVFDREKQGAYALEVEARDGAPSARPNSDNEPNS